MQQEPSQRSGAPYPKLFRLGHSRCKTGCLPCRRRKKKCDELHPQCSACRRNGLKCEWSEKRGSQVTGMSQSSIPASPSPSQISSAQFGCEKSPESFQLLQHYINVTAIEFPAFNQEPTLNPFINCVFPVAFQDELLMHAVLAVSGAHLSHRLANTASLEFATRKHYSYVLQRLQKEINECLPGDTIHVIRLLFVPAFLCLYEVLAGSDFTALSFHLQAIKQGLSHLHDTGLTEPSETNDAHKILSFIREGYAYLQLCNLVLPSPQPSYAPICLPTLASISDASLAQPLSTIFGGSRSLYELVPRAHALFSLRLAEQAAGEVEPSLVFTNEYIELNRAIEGWSMPLPLLGQNEFDEGKFTYQSVWVQNRLAAECIQHALRVYILAASQGCEPPSSSVDSAIQCEVECFAQKSRVLIDTPSASNMLWALVIVGTCVRSEQLRVELVLALTHSRHEMRHLLLVRDALEKLWADRDPRSFGPYGLLRLMGGDPLSFCIF